MSISINVFIKIIELVLNELSDQQFKPGSKIVSGKEGWEPKSREEWSQIAREGYDALPENMKIYINAIREELDKDIAMISIGPDRQDTLVLNDILF